MTVKVRRFPRSRRTTINFLSHQGLGLVDTGSCLNHGGNFSYIFTWHNGGRHHLPLDVLQQIILSLSEVGVLKFHWTVSLLFHNACINVHHLTESIYTQTQRTGKKNKQSIDPGFQVYIQYTDTCTVIRSKTQNLKLYHRFQCFVIFAPSKSIVCSHVTDSMPGGSSTKDPIILRYLPYSIKTKASAAVIWTIEIK